MSLTEKKCKVCFTTCPIFAPVLVQSGYKHPKDLKCPVCNTLHEGNGGLTTEKYLKKLEYDREKLR